MMTTTTKPWAGLAKFILSASLLTGFDISHASEPVSVAPQRAAASTGPVDEPFLLTSQTFTTRTLFTTASINRNANSCKTAVYRGNVYTIYARQGDERMMVAKIPLDGSAAASQPLVGGTDPKARGYTASNNNHKTWQIAVDRAGYIHVTGDMHTRMDMGYWRSKKPEDISSFTQILEYDAPPGTPLPFPISKHTTFPHFRKDRKGQLFWSAQQSSSFLPLCSYDETTRLWTSLGGLGPKGKAISFASAEGAAAYSSATDKSGFSGSAFYPCWDSNNRMHISIGMLGKNIRGPHPAAVGSHILYAYSDDGGKTVFKSDGTPIQFPIVPSAGPNQGEVIIEEMKDDPNHNWLNRHGTISLDKADRPMIAVKSYSTGNHRFRLENGHWVDHPDFDSNSGGSADPSGVKISENDNGKGFIRSWNPNSSNMATIPTPAAVHGVDSEHYRDTGELVWTSLTGSESNGTFTIYLTVFDRVSKVISVDFEPATNSQGTKSGDAAGGFCFYTGLSSGIWNTLTGPVDTLSTSATSQALVPMDGSATTNPVKVTIGAERGEKFTFGNWTTVRDALRGDGIKLDTTTGTSAGITVSGLIPENKYDFALFGSDPAYPAYVTFNGVTRLADGVFKDVTADANGNISGSVARKGKSARLAGLQIQGIFEKLINR
ncbi:MAG: BNR repeat-containing protein [Planctomycetia bacterium]|nr:BNR repeat-containing protein [Planctomycetia bacterium]